MYLTRDLNYKVVKVRFYSLGSLVKFLSGGTPSKSKPNYWNGEIPWASSAELSKSRIHNTTFKLTKEGVKNGSKLAPKSSILLVVRGMSLAKKFRISIAMKEMAFNQDVKAIFPSDKIDQNYLYYFLVSQSNLIKDSTSEASHGTKKLDMSVLENWPVAVPPKQTQRKIASILSAYDDLIENNNQRIKLLEAMAEEIYKEWFVRMRFPATAGSPGWKESKFFDAEGKEVPYGTKGALPEGWEIQKLGDTLESVKRKPKVKKDDYLDFGITPVIDQGDGLINGYVNDKSFLHDNPLPLIVFGDHTRRIKFIDFPFASGADGTQLLIPKNRNLLPTYFYLAIKSIDLSNFHYTRHFKFLKQESVIVPEDSLVLKFNELTLPFLKEVDVLRSKNQLLQETRDLLLPRLISGKLSVEQLNLTDTEAPLPTPHG